MPGQPKYKPSSDQYYDNIVPENTVYIYKYLYSQESREQVKSLFTWKIERKIGFFFKNVYFDLANAGAEKLSTFRV